MKRLNPVPSDLDIAQAAELKPILEIAASLGLIRDDLELYGKYKAKVPLDVLESSRIARTASTLMLRPLPPRLSARARPRPRSA